MKAAVAAGSPDGDGGAGIKARRETYRGDIDGLRAIAVASVVFFHAGLFPFRSGFVGVDIFFVISGYLIGGIILRETAEGRFSFARFYARRARRILPALFLVVLATCAAGWILLDANELKDIGALATMALIGASNINFWQFQDYFLSDARTRVLLMTWSLGVEEQFYLVFPVLIILTMRFARAWLGPLLVVVSLASLAISIHWTWSAPAAAFYLLPARSWELGVGVIMAGVDAGRIFPRVRIADGSAWLQDLVGGLGLLLLLVAVVGFDDHTPFPGYLALLPVLGTVMVIASPRARLNRHGLASRPMVFVGLVSYSWYLWHWPMMSLARTIAPASPSVAAMTGVAAASFALAIASWAQIEKPFRCIRAAPNWTLARYGVALALVAAVPIVIRANGGFPGRLSQQAHGIEAVAMGLQRGTCLVYSGATLDEAPDCVTKPTGQPIVALLGDSHAWALGPGLRDLAMEQGFGYEIMARAACRPLLGVTVRAKTFPTLEQDCPLFREAALAKIIGDPNVTDVILAGYWDPPTAARGEAVYVDQDKSKTAASGLALLRQGLSSMVEALTTAHKRVILVQDVPTWDFEPLRLALAETMPARGAVASLFRENKAGLETGTVATVDVMKHDDIRQIIADVASAHPGVSVLDPVPRFCDAARCTFAIEGRRLYLDKDHLSPLGAEIALRGLQLGAIAR